MDGNAPFDFVNPEWLTNNLTTNTGAIFDDANPNPTIALPNVEYGLRRPPVKPYGHPRAQHRTTYGPLRQAHRNPPLAPSPPPSPTRNRLNPTAQPFKPKQASFRLKVETNVQQEPVASASASATPRTPRIQLSPAEDPTIVSDAAVQAVRQYSRNRRTSSPGLRPTGVQRQGSGGGRRVPMPPPPTITPMSRVVSAPGRYAQAAMNHGQPLMQIPPQQAPVQPVNTAMWLTQVDNVGYADQLREPPTATGAAPPPTARSVTARSRASTHGGATLICDYPNCRHRLKGKTFKTPGELRKHERTHWPESERPLGCTAPGCTSRFFWKKDVDRHVMVVHDKVKFTCQYCGAELCRQDDLDRHIATVHSRHVASPRNWVAPSPSASSVTSFAMTPRSEQSFLVPSTPPTGTSFASGSRVKYPGQTFFASIAEDEDGAAWSVPMMKSLTR